MGFYIYLEQSYVNYCRLFGSKTDERRCPASAAKIGFIKALSSRNDDIVAYNAVIRLIVVPQSQEMARLKAMEELAGKHTMADAGRY